MIQPFYFWVFVQENENTCSKRYMLPKFITALFTKCKRWKKPMCPLIDEWIKMWYFIHIFVDKILLSNETE